MQSQTAPSLKTYSHAELMMMAVMYELAERLKGTNVTVNVRYPRQVGASMTQSVAQGMLPGAPRFAGPCSSCRQGLTGGSPRRRRHAPPCTWPLGQKSGGGSSRYFDTNSKEAAWPAPVLDSATRRRLWTIVEPQSLAGPAGLAA